MRVSYSDYICFIFSDNAIKEREKWNERQDEVKNPIILSFSIL